MKKSWGGRWCLLVLGLILLLLLSACGQSGAETSPVQDAQEAAALHDAEDEAAADATDAADAVQQIEADITTWQEQTELGMQQLAAGNYEEAIAAFTAAIALDPQGETAYSGLADTYVAMGEYEQAAAVWQDTWGGEDNLTILFPNQTQDQELRTALQNGEAGIWITSAGVSQESMGAGAEAAFRLTVLYNLPEDGAYVIEGATNGEAPDSWELLTGEMEAECGAHLRQVELTAAPIQWAEEIFCLRINLRIEAGDGAAPDVLAEDTWYVSTAGEWVDGFLLQKRYEEEKTEESIKQALLSNAWDASAQTLELYQFFSDGTGVSIYSIPVPSVIPFTYSIDAATSTVSITRQEDMASTTRLWSYDAAEEKFSVLYTEYPNEKMEAFSLFPGSARDAYQQQADYWETMWDQEISNSADQVSLGNIVQGMRDLLESIRQYLGYVMTPEAFDALNRELEAWDQDVTAAMESIEWVGSISSLNRLSVNEGRTMDKIAELIARIP